MLFYKTFGDPESSSPLLFLHGFLGSHIDWMPIIEVLKSRYYCIAVDLPSHGKSPYDPDLFLSLEKTITALSSTPLLLVGYSLGGRLALYYGNKHPKKIQGVLTISSHFGLSSLLEKEKRKTTDLLWQEHFKNFSPEVFLTHWYNQSVFASLQKRPHILEELLERRKYTNPTELASILDQASLSKQPLYDKFSHPVRFLFGKEDERYADLYRSLPKDLKVEIENAGHTAHLENPLACTEAIENFLDSLKKSAILYI